jgi:hypothetical protein
MRGSRPLPAERAVGDGGGPRLDRRALAGGSGVLARRRVEAAVLSLPEFTERCPLAPEAEYFDEEIRQLLYGRRVPRNRMEALLHASGEEV